MSSLERLPSEDTDEKTLNSSEEESDGGNCYQELLSLCYLIIHYIYIIFIIVRFESCHT